MRLALGLATLGLILGAIAIYGFLASQDVSSGDVTAAESLTAPTEGERPVDTTIQPSTTSTTSPIIPLWEPNESALLVETSPSDRAVPVRLSIERLDVDAPIGAYGVDNQGRMDVPDNVTEVGWYRFGPSPGEPGSTVLAAHVDLAGPGRGLFYELDEMEEGDLVAVELSDGSVVEYQVIARTTYLKSELPLESIFSRDGDSVLTLVTCGGDFSRSARSYDSNVVVYAVPTA